MNTFSSVPFLRILFPFVGGILLAVYGMLPEVPLPLLATPLLVMIWLFTRNTGNAGDKTLFQFSADIFLVLYAATLVAEADVSRRPDFYGAKLSPGLPVRLVATITAIPAEKERSVKAELKLHAIIGKDRVQHVEGQIIGYFRKSDAAARLRAGQTLVLQTRLSEVPPPANPGEFDYRAYLRNRHVYHTAFVDSAAFAPFEMAEGINPVWRFGLYCKTKILGRLVSCGLSRDALAICSALLTGHDDEIDREVMNAFAHSGTLHVLSVSGLHTGLIYLILNFVFSSIDRRNERRITRFVLITIFLWAFALVTGFAAPVLRAVVMFNLMGLGNLFFRGARNNGLNLLFASAFLLLSYDPHFLLDVGFQLSYTAMIGLLWLQPRFSSVLQPGNRITNYLWQSVTASAAATLTTLPLTLYFFKQFPLWFSLTNIVVVPLSFIVLLLAALSITGIGLVPFAVNGLVSFMVWFISLFDSERFGYIGDITFTNADALLLSLVILLVGFAFIHRRARLLQGALLLIVCWQVYAIGESWALKRKKFLVAYHARNASVMALKNGPKVFLDFRDRKAMLFHARPHLASHSWPQIMERHFNYIIAGSVCALVLDSSGRMPSAAPDRVTVLVVRNNFRMKASGLAMFPNLRLMVADGSVSPRRTEQLSALCRKAGIDFYDTRSGGAFELALK